MFPRLIAAPWPKCGLTTVNVFHSHSACEIIFACLVESPLLFAYGRFYVECASRHKNNGHEDNLFGVIFMMVSSIVNAFCCSPVVLSPEIPLQDSQCVYLQMRVSPNDAEPDAD